MRAPHDINDLLLAASTEEGVARRRGTTTGEAKRDGRIRGARHDPAVPTWLVERGYRFGIVAADCTEAPHVHVVGHGGAAKLWLGPVRLVQVAGYNPRDLREITRIVRQHDEEFQERWHDFCGQT